MVKAICPFVQSGLRLARLIRRHRGGYALAAVIGQNRPWLPVTFLVADGFRRISTKNGRTEALPKLLIVVVCLLWQVGDAKHHAGLHL